MMVVMGKQEVEVTVLSERIMVSFMCKDASKLFMWQLEIFPSYGHHKHDSGPFTAK